MEEASDTNYAVLVRECGGVHELCVPELLLVVRGADLAGAYEELMTRKQQIIVAARDLGMGDELPRAEPPALFAAAASKLFGRIQSKLPRPRAGHAGGR